MHLFLLHAHWINWLEAHMFACPSVRYFRLECPGCGMQRSVIALLKGEYADSLQLYPALIPMIALILYTGAHLLYPFSKGTKIILILQIVVVSVVVAHYIYKIFHYQIIH